MAPGREVHAEGSGNAQMPVLGTGVQNNTFAGGEANRDVVLILNYRNKIAELSAATAVVFSLEVANHGNRTRRLGLRPVGVPAASCSVVPESVVVRPNEAQTAKVVLRAAATTPEAGDREVSIAATDLDIDGRAGGNWASNARQISVLAKPDLFVGVAGAPVRVDGSTTYRTVVTVRNVGNTRLSGNVEVPAAEWLLANIKPGGRPVDASLVTCPGGFELGPGADAKIPVTIAFPDEPGVDQRWDLLLRVSTTRNDLNPRLCRVPLVQLGGAPEPAPAPQIPAVQTETWLSHRAKVPVSLLVAGTIAAAAAGLLLGRSTVPTAAAVTRPTSAAPELASAPIASTQPSPEVSTAAVYSPMPCPTGQWIILIATVEGGYADSDVAMVVRYERDRATRTDRKHVYSINATPFGLACPRVRAWVTRKDKMSTRLLWIGPVASEAAGNRVCSRLKRTSWDCYPRPAA
jgi:hypothetical protein